MKYKVEYLNVLMFLLHELTFFFFFPDKYYCTTAKNHAFNIEENKWFFFFVSVLALVLQFFDMHLLTHSESYTLAFH